jgi:hypothetical protein
MKPNLTDSASSRQPLKHGQMRGPGARFQSDRITSSHEDIRWCDRLRLVSPSRLETQDEWEALCCLAMERATCEPSVRAGGGRWLPRIGGFLRSEVPGSILVS